MWKMMLRKSAKMRNYWFSPTSFKWKSVKMSVCGIIFWFFYGKFHIFHMRQIEKFQNRNFKMKLENFFMKKKIFFEREKVRVKERETLFTVKKFLLRVWQSSSVGLTKLPIFYGPVINFYFIYLRFICEIFLLHFFVGCLLLFIW